MRKDFERIRVNAPLMLNVFCTAERGIIKPTGKDLTKKQVIQKLWRKLNMQLVYDDLPKAYKNEFWRQVQHAFRAFKKYAATLGIVVGSFRDDEKKTLWWYRAALVDSAKAYPVIDIQKEHFNNHRTGVLNWVEELKRHAKKPAAISHLNSLKRTLKGAQ